MVTVLMISGAHCMTCKRMAPVFEAAAQEYEDNPDVKFEEWDIQDAIPYLETHKIEISTLPSVVLVKDGAVMTVLLGFQNAVQLHAAVEDFLVK